MNLFMDMLKKSDAKKLKKFWTAANFFKNDNETYFSYEIRRSTTNPRYWALFRSPVV
jgi:hypothetical protein